MVFFAAACLGMVIALRREVIGGTITTAAMLLFYAVEIAGHGAIPKGIVFQMMLLAGLLFLLSGFVKKRMSGNIRTSPL